MKTFKNLLTILTIVLVAFMAFVPVTSFAADETVTLTVTAPKGVDIKSKTISVYRLFNITEDANGVHYSWDELKATQDFFAQKKYDTVLEATEYVRTLSGTQLTLFAEEYYTYCSNHSEDAVVVTKAAGEDKVFEGLAKGYYLVYDVETRTGEAKSVAILDNLTAATEIALKIETVEVDKKVNQTSANVGEEVEFTITSKVPDTTGYTAYKYIVNDKMSKGLDYTNDSLVVKIGDTVYTKYELTTQKNTETGETTIKIEFDKTEFLKLEKDASIVITYKATLNKYAEVAVENTNEVTIEYSNNPTDDTSTETTPPDIVKVYTYTIDFTKKNVDGTTLAGAEFILEYVTEKGNKYVKMIETNDSETGKVTKVVALVDDKSDATTFKSDENGLFSIAGLKAGSYILTETKAPIIKDEKGNIIDEYVIPNFSFKFTIAETLTEIKDEEGNVVEVKVKDSTLTYTTTENAAKDYFTITSGNTQTDETPVLNDKFSATVLNAHKGELPSTGGMGTTIFTVIGIAVMAAAVIVLVVRNRKND